MPKEMHISSSPHETKVAVLEDDQLVEVYFERDTDVGLVGGIYKGRVSRVLPGMQSAFVDIGLERDAFLYVSDFFYEDQEEYDRVFEEAEARATKLTAPQPEVSTAPAPVPTPVVAEAPPAEVTEAAAPAATPESPAVAPSPVEAPVAPVAPSASVAAPPAPREPHDRRPFDQRRGRRRRHRGRPDFRENRHDDRRFAPSHRPEGPTPESYTFEILPGESLAKYSHPTPTSAENLEAPSEVPPASVEFGVVQEESANLIELPGEGGHVAGSASVGEVAEVPLEAGPPPGTLADATAVKPPVSVEPRVEATTVEPAIPTAVLPVATALNAAVTDSTVPFSPVALKTPVVSFVSEGAPAGVPASVEPFPAAPTPTAPASVPIVPLLAAPVVRPEPAADVVASLSAAESESPAPSSPAEPAEPVPAPMASAETSQMDAAPEAARTDPTESASEFAEAGGVEEGAEEFEEGLEEGEEIEEGPEGELVEEGELAAPAAADAEGAAQLALTESAAEEAPVAEAPGERTYTLREPHQRPRFAPRRRRGRRGMGDRGPRRSDKPRESSRPGNHHPVQIAEVLKEGQEIIVQIAKEPLGTKGARITSHVALPGRYLVYMPTIEHIGVSRKIASEEERLRLRNIILENRGSLTGGFIVRTAGQGRPEDEFKADLRFLSTLWSEIRSKSDRLKAPALLHRDLDLVQRLLRDLLTPDFKSVRVDSEIDYERVLDFVNRCQPALIGKVKLYSRDAPLFEEFGIQQELDKALKPKVWLKSGGYIVINQTEALVAIDVNTGKYVGKTNRLEDTIVKTNIDAVNEIVRQVRLRDLGGIIVIDFIDMDERKNRAKVVQALEEALRSDRAPTKVISFHDFGLVAVTRKRVKQSLERTLCEPCNYCSGSGWVKSVNTICNEILAEARKMAKGIDGRVMTLRVNPEVARALKSREGGLVSELESLTKKDVIIKGDPMVHQERFEIF